MDGFRQEFHVCLKFPSIRVEYFQVSVDCPLPLLTFHGVSNRERGHVSFFIRELCEVFAALTLPFVSCPELSDRLSLDPFFCEVAVLDPVMSTVRVTGSGGTRSVRELTSERTDLSPSEQCERRY